MLYSAFGSVFSETCRSSNTFKIALICLKFSFPIFFSPQGAGSGETLGARLLFVKVHPSESLENLNQVLKHCGHKIHCKGEQDKRSHQCRLI